METSTANILVSASKLRRARQKAGLSQQRLGELADVWQTNISRVENAASGTAGMRPETYVRIIKALGVKFDDLTAEPNRAAA